MGLRINTNIASINSLRNLSRKSKAVNHSLAKLSSGERITKSADDAAGLAISEKFKASIRGYKTAKRSAMDGVSMIQTAEGGLNEISNILIRLRELSVQSASDTIGPQERSFLQMEYQSLSDEIERIANGTDFNGVALLKGEGSPHLQGDIEFQVGIKNRPTIDRIAFDPKAANATTEGLGIKGTACETKVKAQTSLAVIDTALGQVNKMRASFGALQNRLSSTINNTDVMIENLSAANSRVRDADIAETTAELSKDIIIREAGAAMLAQANKSIQVALQLLQSF